MNYFQRKNLVVIMGHVSTVYGCIICPWSQDLNHARLNKITIRAIPASDETFPWLNKGMFLVPDPDVDYMYRDQVITFGASYKDVEIEWDIWLGKFESLLRRLYWVSANIHLDSELAGKHEYEWESFDWLDNKPAKTREFKGGPRIFVR